MLAICHHNYAQPQLPNFDAYDLQLFAFFVKIVFQVLYKSRCDNRLNEITERARADKSEVCLEFKIHTQAVNSIALKYSQYY